MNFSILIKGSKVEKLLIINSQIIRLLSGSFDLVKELKSSTPPSEMLFLF